MTKQELRIRYTERRKALTEKEVLVNNDLLLIGFQQFPLQDVQSLLTYWPMATKGEVNTHIMADYVSFRIPGLRLAFPVMNMREKRMEAVLVDDNTGFAENSFGIMEPLDSSEVPPEDIDMVFVPLLAFDTHGYRVGYGKGFYDRFLKRCKTDVLKVGFSFFEPEEAIDDVNEFDVPLNVCITPNRIYEF